MFRFKHLDLFFDFIPAAGITLHDSIGYTINFKTLHAFTTSFIAYLITKFHTLPRH